MNKAFLIKGAVAIIALWLVVWGVSQWAADRKASAERVVRLIDEASFDEWSEELSESRRTARREKIDEIAQVLNRLDLRQREQLHETRAGMKLFLQLGSEEKIYFLEKTLTQSMRRMMEAFDKMDKEERRAMVARSIKDMRSGPGGEDLARLEEEDPEVIERIVQVGLQTYYQDASAETKLDLVPLMDAFGEVIQGFAKPDTSL